MIRTSKLLGIFAEKGVSQRAVAKMLGINEATFYRKMSRGVFDSDEIYAMIAFLDIENPADIFFAAEGTRGVPGSSERND